MLYNVLKDGVINDEVINEEEQEYEDYNSDGTELVYSSDEEEKQYTKRTTGFLVFVSENKKDKTDLSIMNLGPSSKNDLDQMTQLGEMWKDLSEEDHTNYVIKAQLINNQYAEIMNVELD